jgi:hopene-associated glycosyltransferase HpnB
MLELTFLSALIWLILLLLPWRPWSTRECLVHAPTPSGPNKTVSALIPARDESQHIERTLRALSSQKDLGHITVVDDQSSDGTAEIVETLNLSNVSLVNGEDPPGGWTGKLWALQQGLPNISSELLLLIDADIELERGALAALLQKQEEHDYDLVSVMATLHVKSFWEKLLLPPFIYFFKLIYPFALSNKETSSVAAAAGGCILIKTSKIQEIGGFTSLKHAIIDDCTLAKRIKEKGGKIWLGLSTLVSSTRPSTTLGSIWNMVARTAYTQLNYSLVFLLLCSILLLICFVIPLIQIFIADTYIGLVALTAFICMTITYYPVIKFYNLSTFWLLTLPFASALFLAMTWTSAMRYWRGERARWKERSYRSL